MIGRILFTILLQAAGTSLFAQKIIISGTESLRPLKWSDFTGKPDNNSPYFALTGTKLNYAYNGVQFEGDMALLKGFEVTLQLDETTSWVKKGKESDALLKHEQGHFDIALIGFREIQKKVAQASFTRNDFKNEMRNIFIENSKKYREMNLQYDKETDHSKNKEMQQTWDTFISKELQK